MDTTETEEIDFLSPNFLSDNIEPQSNNFEDARQLRTRLHDYLNSQLDNAETLPPKQVETLLKLLDRLEAESMVRNSRGTPVKIKNFNIHYAPLFFSSAFLKIVYGGTGTGKSHCALGQYPLKRIIEEEGLTYYGLRETKEAIEGSIYDTMKFVADQEDWHKYLKFKTKDGYPYIESLTTGSKIMFRGLDKIEKLLSQRPTGFLIEEADFLTPEIFEELERRIRGGDDSKKEIIMCLNPRKRANWMVARFLKNTDPDIFTLKCIYTNNRFLTETDIKRFEKLKETNYPDYVRMVEGDWYFEPEEKRVSFFVELD